MEFSRNILLINRYFREKRQSYLEPYGLKGYHARFLIEISGAPGISQDGLSQKLGVDKSNVTRQAAFLEEGGYLTRESDPADKRVLRLYATEKALALIEPLKKETQQWEHTLLDTLSPGEQEVLRQLLDRLRREAQKEV